MTIKGIVRESLRDGLVAGLGFGGFFILLAQTGELSGLWPLVAARTTSVPMLLIVTLVRRRSLALSPGSRLSALSAGVLDMLANIFFLLSSRSGLLIIVAVITALYPAPTVLLHWIVLKEKLGVVKNCRPGHGPRGDCPDRHELKSELKIRPNRTMVARRPGGFHHPPGAGGPSFEKNVVEIQSVFLGDLITLRTAECRSEKR